MSNLFQISSESHLLKMLENMSTAEEFDDDLLVRRLDVEVVSSTLEEATASMRNSDSSEALR